MSKDNGCMVLASDGKYHGHTTPEQDAATDDWFRFKEALWAIGAISVTPTRAVAVSPQYQHDNIEKNLRAALAWLRGFEEVWHAQTKQSSA